MGEKTLKQHGQERPMHESEFRNAELLPYFTADEKARLLLIHQRQNGIRGQDYSLSVEEEEIFAGAEARRDDKEKQS